MSDPDSPHAAGPEGAMTPKALAAFEQYYQLGAGRSLRKLAAALGVQLSQLERWSTDYAWQRLVRERHQEEVNASRAAARKEAAALARRRLRNAQLMQEAALTILSRAKIIEMEPEDARKALSDARALLTEGMRAERLELGEVTERTVAPPKPLGDMSDDELQAYIALLEESA